MAVGLIYDPIYLEHDTRGHIENASRLIEVMSLLESSGSKGQLVNIPPQKASVDALTQIHVPDYISRIESAAQAGGGWLDGDTVMSPDSYEAALYAAGGAMGAVDGVMSGEVNSAFALVRPPGHHAIAWRAMGFCLFNNIAVAARYAMEKYGLERILIVDFDVHHGNGTQDAFYSDPDVLYFSTHQYPFYPGTGEVEESGDGKAKGFTINVPLPAGCGDNEYIGAFENILVPVARRFRPQLIMVSAGYDAHWFDLISLMRVSVSGFARMTSIIKQLAGELCGGKLVISLEGGYHLEALAFSVKATFDVLLGKSDIEDLLGPAPDREMTPNIDALIERIKRSHRLE